MHINWYLQFIGRNISKSNSLGVLKAEHYIALPVSLSLPTIAMFSGAQALQLDLSKRLGCAFKCALLKMNPPLLSFHPHAYVSRLIPKSSIPYSICLRLL